jgi:hypothetical protein
MVEVLWLLTYAIIIAMDDEGWTIGEFLWKSLKFLFFIGLFYLCYLFSTSTPLGQQVNRIMDFIEYGDGSAAYFWLSPFMCYSSRRSLLFYEPP